MKILKALTIAANLLIAISATAHAQTVLLPGESVRISCANGGGGGGGGSTQCIQQLSDWCYSWTSFSRDQCYQKASGYCPATSYVTCVKDTAEYCYRQTSMSKDQCFESALGTCRGNPESIQSLLENVRTGAILKEKGLDLNDLKHSN